MKKHLFLLTALVLLVLSVFSQVKTITGKVINEKGEPIPYATIKIRGKKSGVSADENGNYSIQVNAGDVLLVSSTNIRSKEITVGGSNVLNIEVVEQNSNLEEVVVTAMGITRRTKALGYSVQQINSDELTKARETNVVNSLAGKLAGVRVTSQSGTLGGSAKIIIRGVSSMSNSSQPIFVIDGMPLDNGSPTIATVAGAGPTGSASVDFGNRAGDINPDDIESISVLKGASATALYGARAKNGAVVITTKKGKKGRNAVTFNSSTRFDNVLKLPEFQNEYAQGSNGVYNRANLNGWGPKISDVQDLQFPNYLEENETLKAYPDNIKDFYETGNTYINSIAFEGGNEDSDFRLSYTNTMQDGTTANQSLKRNALSFNAGKTFSKLFNVRANISYTGTASNGKPLQSANNLSILGEALYIIPRTVDMNKLRDNSIDPATGEQITLSPAKNGNNPFWIINNNGYSNRVDRTFGNVILNFKPFSWLTISNNLGMDFYSEFRKGVTRNGTIGRLSGEFMEANLFNKSINNDLMATGNFKLSEDLSLKTLVGGNLYETQFRSSQSLAQELTIDQLYNFANAASVVTQNYMEKKRLLGVYGEIEFNYRDYLFLNATGRNDWSSALPFDNRSYFYPSVSASFVFSEFVTNDWLSYGKVRASVSGVGSDDQSYQTTFSYVPKTNVYTQYGFGVNFPFNGALAYSIPITRPAYDLKPQHKNEYEFGLEARFLQNRINLDVTYYSSLTKNQILALAVPHSTGYRTERTNAGSVENTGVEIQLGIVPIKKKDFTWNIDGNFSTNKQKVKELPASLVSGYSLASGWSSLEVKATQGESFALYGNGWERDPEGNIVLDSVTGLRNTTNNVRLGSIFPDYMLGINNNFNYKGFNIGFLIDIRQGGVIYSNTASLLRTNGLAKETGLHREQTFIDAGVTQQDGKFVPNTVAVNSMEDYWTENFKSDNTEANVFDASYVKLRELRLSYALPATLFSKGLNFIKACEIGVEARNLWIIHDNVPHIDPEANFFQNAANSSSNGIGEGVEFNSVPSTRTIGFNVRFKF